MDNKSRRLYTVTKAGHKAVANKFILPKEDAEEVEPDESEKIKTINIEKIQAIWFASPDEITQTTNNPSVTKKTVDALTEQLLNAIEPEISSYKLATYKRNLQDLKTQINSQSPSQLTLQKLFGYLSFMENLEGSIPLASIVWPYLYPLLLIAKAKIPQES